MSAHAHEHGSSHTHHVVPWRNYGLNAIALAILMFLTIGAAFLNLPYHLNPVVALAIAVTKAVLIVLFFMNTWYSTRLTWVFVGAAFFWLLILLGLFLPDYIARDFHSQPEAWNSSPYVTSVAPPDQRPIAGSDGGH